ncbi:MAG: DUF4190 domain-containing protein, partial [Actinobacteria bacterium]|nr:DUF4190 domain-containing protein [Actinomycetota bacterium]
PPPPTAPGPPGAPPAQPPVPRAKQATSGWAIASLILGICGFTCIPLIGSVLAIVFGFLAKSEIKKSSGRVKGSGLATAGIVLGIILIALIVIAAAVTVPLYFVYVGPERIVTRTVDLGGATGVNAEINMRSGYLNVGGDATQLISGEFTYNFEKGKPDIGYNVTDGTGNLTIEQKGGWFWPWWPVKNDWDVRFNNLVPLDLRTKLSAGESTLDLKTLNLTGLNINASAGDVSADLSGRMELLKQVRAKLSLGHMDLKMGGEYGTPMYLDMNNSAGDIDLDLLGRWKADLDANIKTSAGGIGIKLPRDVGVYVTADSSAGDVVADGLRGDPSGAWVNDVYGTSPVTLRLDVSTSAGDINLRLGD